MPAAPASTVPAVKAYLFTQLQARPEMAAPVLVSYDDPGPNMPDDIVALLDVDREVATLAMVGSGGAGSLMEEYVLTVVVSSFRGGDAAQTVYERACALADVVVDVVRQDPSCGGIDGLVKAQPASVNYQSEWNTQELDDGSVVTLGRTTTVTVGIRCVAQI